MRLIFSAVYWLGNNKVHSYEPWLVISNIIICGTSICSSGYFGWNARVNHFNGTGRLHIFSQLEWWTLLPQTARQVVREDSQSTRNGWSKVIRTMLLIWHGYTCWRYSCTFTRVFPFPRPPERTTISTRTYMYKYDKRSAGKHYPPSESKSPFSSGECAGKHRWTKNVSRFWIAPFWSMPGARNCSITLRWRICSAPSMHTIVLPFFFSLCNLSGIFPLVFLCAVALQPSLTFMPAQMPIRKRETDVTAMQRPRKIVTRCHIIGIVFFFFHPGLRRW